MSQKIQEDSGNRRRRPRKNRKKKRGRVLLTVLLLAAAVLFVSAAEVSGAFSKNRDVNFRINPGDGTSAIADRLEDQGLIRSSLLFRAVSKAKGADRNWDYGLHKMKAGLGYGTMIRELTSPETASVKVTLPEGLQAVQMAAVLEKKEICSKKEFMEACTGDSYEDWDFLKGIPTQKRIGGLEGYLFPDTYYFEKNTDPETVIRTMLARFKEKVCTEKIRKKAEKMNLSIDETVILASMAESEAVTEADRRTVSGVFLNRLEKDDKLQSCVTVEYAKRIKKTIISLEDTKYDSPYNTYMYRGLPYGPICCPGMESVNAVLYNEDHDYYYFQSDQYGRLHFAETYQEHVRIQKEVQKDWEVKVTKIE